MPHTSPLLLLAALLTLSGCATPTEKSYHNLTFSAPNHRPLRLDLYVPTQKTPPPLILWIHGGGWRYGDKRLRLFVREFTKDGFAIASIQYRLT